MKLFLCTLLFIVYCSILTDAVFPVNIPIEEHNNGACSSELSLNAIRSNIEQVLNTAVAKGLHEHFPANSCADIYSGHPSGYYWLNVGDQPQQVYCSLNENRCCNQTHANWMRIAYLNMSDPTQQCPSGWREINLSSIRTCRRQRKTRISSVSYSSNGIPYSRVCGRIIAYQFGHPEGFLGYNGQNQRTLNDSYVDGVSITYGKDQRHHIWTFAAARGTNVNHICPCTKKSSTAMVPHFINEDYFCERGTTNNKVPNPLFFKDDPLWDGRGCTGSSTCCEFNNPPWFCKQLPQPTTEDIEIRIMAYVGRGNSLEDEDTPIKLIEIYVQ